MPNFTVSITMTIPNSETSHYHLTYLLYSGLLWLQFIRPLAALIRLVFLHRAKVRSPASILDCSDPIFTGNEPVSTKTVASASILSKIKNTIERLLVYAKPVYHKQESRSVSPKIGPLSNIHTPSDGDLTLVDPTLLTKLNSSAEMVTPPHLYSDAIPIVGTFKDLAFGTISERSFRRATQLPFGLQRMLEFDKLTERTTCVYNLHPDLTYRSMLRTISVGTDSLAELPLPDGADAGKSTKLAMLFIETVVPQLSSIAQALLDVVNGTYDVDRCLCIVQDCWQMLESRISGCGGGAMNYQQYETLLRFYQLYRENLAVGNKRQRSAAESCKLVLELRKFHYLKPLDCSASNKYAIMRQYSRNIRSAAKAYYAEAFRISSDWSELKPKLKTGLFHRGLSEIQAEKVMENARGLVALVQQLNYLQHTDLKYYTAYAEKEYLKLLFYVDKNQLCIKLSEQMTFGQIHRETCQLLRGMNSADQSVLEVLDWLY